MASLTLASDLLVSRSHARSKRTLANRRMRYDVYFSIHLWGEDTTLSPRSSKGLYKRCRNNIDAIIDGEASEKQGDRLFSPTGVETMARVEYRMVVARCHPRRVLPGHCASPSHYSTSLGGPTTVGVLNLPPPFTPTNKFSAGRERISLPASLEPSGSSASNGRDQ